MQAPAALQRPTGVSVPALHEALPHEVLVVGNLQLTPTPSHMPAHTPVPPQTVRAGVPPVRGLPTIGMHVPSEPASLHDVHWPVQSALQQ